MGTPAEVSVNSGTGLPRNATENLVIDSQPMSVSAVEKDYAFSIPARDVYRFEVRNNDFGWSGDEANNNRRSELVSKGEKYNSGETLWSSFSFVVGPDHLPFDADGEIPSPYHHIIHQWHSVDTVAGRSPLFAIELRDGDFIVSTRSDDDPSRNVIHYSKSRPTDGVAHNVVVAGLLGRDGHLDVWLDGKRIVDVDTAIGYYNDDGPLAYPHWGIYQHNVDDPAVLYHANIEWGRADLSARIVRPLAVVKPPGGWV
ncbi:heparin lyase I family protein [Mycobacterium barrassiae]|uniref:polysaccharide lyase n=1 Tax=Mycobacterium barrassiae TaxID=319709 RepID=UPI002265DB82|nr:polysaccharide lyase [Mycobacterium barrassiae]MCV7303084.1 heparin lyase I family protein [Mycobacterium barrassiae]